VGLAAGRRGGPNAGQRTLERFTKLDRKGVRLGMAGKIMTARHSGDLMAGVDFVLIGRAPILRPDFPDHAAAEPGYASPNLPVSEAFLRDQGAQPAADRLHAYVMDELRRGPRRVRRSSPTPERIRHAELHDGGADDVPLAETFYNPILPPLG
jgi:hypothetical protein